MSARGPRKADEPTPTQAGIVADFEDLVSRFDALVARAGRAWWLRPGTPEHALVWFINLYGHGALRLYRQAKATGARLRTGSYIPGTLTILPPVATVTNLAAYRAARAKV